MPRLVLRLVKNAVTGKREVEIAYESDPDALPVEHEQEHRRLVEQVVGSLSSRKLEVERGSAGSAAGQVAADEQVAERKKLRQ